MRYVIALNWMLGTVFLAVALLFPLGWKAFMSAKTNAVILQVSNIAKAEQQLEAQRRPYVLFGPKQMSTGFAQLSLSEPADREFTYSVFRDRETSGVVIQARASAKAVAAGWIPPMTYRYHLADGKAEWRGQSTKRRGLLGLF